MIIKIISGGQTGGDYGGLLAGQELGLKTGGYCPAGWKTELGANIGLENFGLICTKSVSYPFRTRLNVVHSDGTVGFGGYISPGMKLTIKRCEEFEKPYFHVFYPIEPEVIQKELFIQWVIQNKITVLNVAGNRESSNSGIEQFTKDFLISTIKEYNG